MEATDLGGSLSVREALMCARARSRTVEIVLQRMRAGMHIYENASFSFGVPRHQEQWIHVHHAHAQAGEQTPILKR